MEQQQEDNLGNKEEGQDKLEQVPLNTVGRELSEVRHIYRGDKDQPNDGPIDIHDTVNEEWNIRTRGPNIDKNHPSKAFKMCPKMGDLSPRQIDKSKQRGNNQEKLAFHQLLCIY